jgi:hypothetical protein
LKLKTAAKVQLLPDTLVIRRDGVCYHFCKTVAGTRFSPQNLLFFQISAIFKQAGHDKYPVQGSKHHHFSKCFIPNEQHRCRNGGRNLGV